MAKTSVLGADPGFGNGDSAIQQERLYSLGIVLKSNKV